MGESVLAAAERVALICSRPLSQPRASAEPSQAADLVHLRPECTILHVQIQALHFNIVDLSADLVHAVGRRTNEHSIRARPTSDAEQQVDDLVGSDPKKYVARRRDVPKLADELLDGKVSRRGIAVERESIECP